MNLKTTLEIFAGGPGSGCNPAVAEPRCGRPSGSRNSETRWDKPSPGVFEAVIDGKIITITRQPINGQITAASPWEIKVGGKLFGIEKTTATKIRIKAENGVYTGRWTGFTPPPKFEKPVTTTTNGAPKGNGTTIWDFTKAVSSEIKNGVAAIPYQRLLAEVDTYLRAAELNQDILRSVGHVQVSLVNLPRHINAQYSWSQGAHGLIKLPKGRVGLTTAETFIHELGHHFDYHILKFGGAEQANARLGMEKEYFAVTDLLKSKLGPEHAYYHKQWEQAVWSVPIGKQAVTNYALTNSEEWFAETFAKYIVAPQMRDSIKTNTPKTYEVIKNILSGKFKGRSYV